MKTQWFLAASAALAVTLGLMRAGAAECDPVGEIRFVCGQNGPEDLVECTGFGVAHRFGLRRRGGHSPDRHEGRHLHPAVSKCVRQGTTGENLQCLPRPPRGNGPGAFPDTRFVPEARSQRAPYAVCRPPWRAGVGQFFEPRREGEAAGDYMDWLRGGSRSNRLERSSGVAGRWLCSDELRPSTGTRRTRRRLYARATGRREQRRSLGMAQRVGVGEGAVGRRAGANGLEISKDGKWFYVAQWGNRSFMRLSRGQTPPTRDVIESRLPHRQRPMGARWNVACRRAGRSGCGRETRRSAGQVRRPP